jgi:eukaryotic-like serine/threonine-protein kinase
VEDIGMSSHWKRVDAIFAEALGLAPEDRADYVAGACDGDDAVRAEVESLLARVPAAGTWFAERSPGLLLEHQGLIPTASLDPGRRVGPYRIVRLLGAGGMGAVYLAERADGEFDRQVAVKIVHPAWGATPDATRRFLRERQILARLEHPNIARLHDGGLSDDGLPWLAMEYVEGVRIDEYCLTRALPLRERIRLIQAVGRAVHHAHRHLIIHRDLKPTNILVTGDGVPKLLDFGIAKLLEGESGVGTTQTDARPMTPAYAAPEQARDGHVTTATDTYALGVLLQELLTGQRRGDRSGGRKKVPGDLERICLMAMREEPERRYESVQALVDDLEQFLEGRPVRARPDTVTYRTRRFISRHRTGVAAAALVAVSLVVGLGTSLRQSRIAREEAAKAREVSGFVLRLFEVSDPDLATGEEQTVRDLLDRGVQRIETELAGQPGVQAEMYALIGPIHARMGLFEDGRAMLRRALELYQAQSGAASTARAAVTHELARLEHRAGRLDLADTLYREAQEGMARRHGPRSAEAARIEHDIARLAARRGHHAVADSLFANARAVLVAAQAPPIELLRLDLDHVEVIHAIGDPVREDSVYTRIIAGRGHLESDRSLALASVMLHTGIQALHGGGAERAEPLLASALELRRQVHGELHPDVGLAMAHLAVTRQRLGRHDEALIMQRQAVDILRETLGSDHPDYALWLAALAVRLVQDGNFEDGARSLAEVERIQAATLGEGHFGLAMTRRNLARALMSVDRASEAVPLLEVAVATWIAARGDGDFFPWMARLDLAHALASLGHGERADSLVEVVLTRLNADAPRGIRLGDALLVKARLRAREGRYPEAADLARSALDDYDARGVGERDVLRAGADAALGAYLIELGELAAAEPLLLRAHVTFDDMRGPRSEQAVTTRQHLARLYHAWGRPEEAARFLSRSN